MPDGGRLGGSRFFLNALREDHQLAPPDTGKWRDDSDSRDFLSKYASDIYLSGQLADSRVSHSVPSVFARPIQFYQALREKRNPLHKAFVNEWRGLLAIVGLKSWMGLDVQAERFDVPPEDPNATSEVGSVRSDTLHLGTMLRKQLPQPESDWTRWWMIYSAGHLVGATSPWTMVYTPAQYSCPDGVYWRDDNGLLTDPIRYFDPKAIRRSDELALLLRWVELVLNERVGNWGMPEHLDRQKNVISERLEEWRNDLAPYRRDDIRIERLAGFPLAEEVPYRFFLTPPPELLAVGSAQESDLAIRSNKIGERDVLALSRTKLSAGDRVYRSVLVNQVDVARLPSEGTGFTSKGGTAIPVSYVFVEETFFPPKLVELPLASPAMQRGSANLAIPLTRKFFKYFDHRDLTETGDMLQIAETDKAVRVNLRIPLKGGRWLSVDKTYDRATDVIRLEEGGTPAFAVWPDFHAEDWHENYAAYAGPRPGRGIPDFRAAPLFGDGTALASSKMDGTEKAVRIWHCAKPPIGFELSYRNQDTNQLFDAGVLLLDSLVRPTDTSTSRSWNVGVDFGTSSTAVAVRRDGGRVEVLRLKGRTKFLTITASDRHEAISQCLYPAEGAIPPFRTLLYQSDATVIGGDSDDYTLRFMYFADEQHKPISNVKWGTNFRALTDYLKGLVRYIGCEARNEGVGNLTLQWSYPLALPENQYTAMSGFWGSVKNTFERESVIKVTVESGIPESDAICRCLDGVDGTLNIRADTLSIAVDVGGGSTDIGFWTRKNLFDQVSFKLAGNDVLNSRLFERKNYLGMLYRVCAGQDMPENEREFIEGRASIYLNHLLLDAKDISGRTFDGRNPRLHPVPVAIHGGKADGPPWLYIRTVAYLFFMGIAYYIGLHARKRPTTVPEITIYFGGRGSSVLAWLTGDEEKAGAILGNAFMKGYDLDGEKGNSVKIRFGGPSLRFMESLPPLKLEVALGLLSNPLGTVERKTSTLLGETGWVVGGERAEWDREITVDDLALLQPPKEHDSGYIGRFLTDVLVMHPELNLDMENLKRLKLETGSVQNSISKAIEKTERVLQPVFAFELRALLEGYIDLALRSSQD